jgi:hypothetical protein
MARRVDREGRGSSSNPISQLLDTVQDEGVYSAWTYVAVFLLICSFIGAGVFWHGLNGRGCSTAWGDDFPFGLARKPACLLRSLFENLPDRDGSRTPRTNVVTPPANEPINQAP